MTSRTPLVLVFSLCATLSFAAAMVFFYTGYGETTIVHLGGNYYAFEEPDLDSLGPSSHDFKSRICRIYRGEPGTPGASELTVLKLSGQRVVTLMPSPTAYTGTRYVTGNVPGVFMSSHESGVGVRDSVHSYLPDTLLELYLDETTLYRRVITKVTEYSRPLEARYIVNTVRVGEVSDLNEQFLPKTLLSRFESVILRVKQETSIQDVYSVIGTLSEMDGFRLRFAYSSHHDGL